MGYAGGGANGTLRWKDLALDILLPVDHEKEEAERAVQARKMASGATANQHQGPAQPQLPPQQQLPPPPPVDTTMEEEDAEDDDENENDENGDENMDDEEGPGPEGSEEE